jgi:hypothetical protein
MLWAESERILQHSKYTVLNTENMAREQLDKYILLFTEPREGSVVLFFGRRLWW